MMHDDEAAWQAYLDANPDDHGARKVFADWLEDRVDDRGPGYRAMGILGVYPEFLHGMSRWVYDTSTGRPYPFEQVPDQHWIPKAWFEMAAMMNVEKGFRSFEDDSICTIASPDELAIAWSRLTPEQQGEILAEATV